MDASFLGPLVGDVKIAFLDSCDLLVFPSRQYRSGRSEGLPVSMIEALARGRVVVASNAGGIPEIIRDGQNGYLFAARHDDALGPVLAGIVSSWPRSAGVAAAARQTGVRFTASAMAPRHEASYQALVSASVPAARQGSA